MKNVEFMDYEEYSPEYIGEVFTEQLYDEIIEENAKDCAGGVSGKNLKECWKDICKEIKKIPSAENLMDLYERLGIKSKLSDIDVSDDKEQELVEYSPCVRNRVTLMRLRKCILLV